jgi:hypothetical protein
MESWQHHYNIPRPHRLDMGHQLQRALFHRAPAQLNRLGRASISLRRSIVFVQD